MATQKDINLAFQMIVSTASDMDMCLPQAAKQHNEKLSVDEQKKMLAAFARYVSEGHPGFATENAPNITFSEETKNKFKTELVKLYLTTKQERTEEEIGKEIFKLAKKYIPDNHFNVYSSEGASINTLMSKEEHLAFKEELQTYIQTENLDSSHRCVLDHLYTERHQVGKNLFLDDEFELLKQNGAEIVSEKKGQTWRMAEINHQGKKLMLFGMKSFAPISSDGKIDIDKINDFTSLAKEFSKQEYENCDALILDLRSNGGGWPHIGDYIARTLYGNTVSTEAQGHLKMDTLAAKLSYFYMEKADKKNSTIDRLKLKDEPQRTQYVQQDKLWGEEHPFNSALGYTKPILLLTDQNTGSNAELTIGRLREHPYVRTIGDHSCGVIQYHPAATSNSAIPLPYGLKISLPPEGFTSTHGERLEGTGYVPDYKVEKGQSALLTCLEKLDEIKQEISQNLPPERTVETEAKRESHIDKTDNIIIKNIGENNPQLKNAFNELLNATSTIPQLQAPERQNVYSLHQQKYGILTH